MTRLTLVLSLAAVSCAQTNSGVVTGRILNSQHQPLVSSKVLVQRDGKDVVSGVTDANGSYRFNLPPGDYRLRVGTITKPISVADNKTTKLDIELAPSSDQPQFFDEPRFTVAGVTDNTYRGGHGSDNILRSSETLTKATASLSRANESEAEPHHLLAEQDEQSGHSLEAVKEYQTAAELNPSERNLFDWGTELLSHRAPQAAAEVFSKGRSLFPHSQRMLLGLATSWYAAGSYEKAAKYFFDAIDIDPDDPNPYAFLIKAQSKEITQAPGYFERFARFAQLQPDSALANYYYGATLLAHHRGSEAETFLKKAVMLDSHLAAAYLDLGIACADDHKYSEAINAYKLAIREDPNIEEAHYRLSEAYRLTGDHSSAAQELAIYRQLSRQSAEKLEQERREIQQFVVKLKNQ